MNFSLRGAARLLACACLLHSPATVAENTAGGAWLALYGSGALNGGSETPWRYGVYGDARRTQRLDGINQYTFQPGAGYRFNSRLSAWAGYTYFRSEVVNGASLNEHRSWQQLSWNVVRWHGSALRSRTRLEQRHRKGQDGTDWRLRQQFRLDARLPLDTDLSYILGNEFFYNLEDTGWTATGHHQNRFYTGLGWDFHRYHVEALYMNQRYRLEGLPDKANHLLVVNVRL
jgi:hypothetical protein